MSTQAPTISLVAGTTYRFSATWASDDAHATPINLTGCEAVFAVVSYQGETLLTCETTPRVALPVNPCAAQSGVCAQEVCPMLDGGELLECATGAEPQQCCFCAPPECAAAPLPAPQ